MPSSTRILFGECTAGLGEGDREFLFAEARADANVYVENDPEQYNSSCQTRCFRLSQELTRTALGMLNRG